MAFGSIGDWAAISLGGSSEGAVPTKGIDVWQGKATLLLGALIVVGILALRFVQPQRRNMMAIAIIVAGVAGLALALWALLALKSVVHDNTVEALTQVLERQGVAATKARQQILEALDKEGIAVKAQIGLWMTVAGGVLATAGGFVDLAWVRQKKIAGNTIDPDTLPVTAEVASADGTGSDVDPEANP
jgi:hypothetical protein